MTAGLRHSIRTRTPVVMLLLLLKSPTAPQEDATRRSGRTGGTP